MAGTLDAEVDPDALFRLDAADPVWAEAGTRWLELLAAIERARLAAQAAETTPRRRSRRRSRADDDATPAPLEDGRDDLVDAYARFFAQPLERQHEQLEAQRRRHAAIEAEAQQAHRQRELATTLDAAAARIEAFVRGEADGSVDPDQLLSRDLLADGAPTQDQELRTRLLAPSLVASTATDAPAPAPTTPAPTAAKPVDDREPAIVQPQDAALEALRQAKHRYEAAWLALARLSPEERAAIVLARRAAENHAATETEADDETPALEDPVEASEKVIDEAVARAAVAAAEREEALASARAARSESLRVLAEERVALLEVKETQAHFAADLERRRAQMIALHEATLEWQRRVRSLDDRPPSDVASAADGMYDPLRSSLADARNRLRELLDDLSQLGSSVPDVASVPRATTEAERTALEELRARLVEESDVLRVQEATTVWELARSVRDDAVALNRARLRLLELASPSLRDEVTGLGAAGVDQVRREFDQIGLELRYQGRAWPRFSAAALTRAKQRPVALGWVLGQLGLLLAAFSLWRRSADGVLQRMRARLLERGLDAGSPNLRSTLVYYVRRIRSPVEWLIVFTVATHLAGELEAVPEFRPLWLTVTWSLVGRIVVMTVDAIAARQEHGRGEAVTTAALRLASLRLVGYTIVAVGLVLSLSAELVGEGAIYRWVLRLCWFLSIPVTLRLLQRWRPVIFARMDARAGRDALVRWVVARRNGWRGYVAGFVGGVYLLAIGFMRWGTRLLQGADLTRRLLAYMFRRAVSKHARGATDERRALTPEELDALAPDGATEQTLDTTVDVERELVALLLAEDAAMVAIVGERGAGKSTFLRTLAARPELGPTIIIECAPGRPERLFDTLAAALGCGAEPSTLREHLRGRRLRVFVDDAQRLVRPTIGGLTGFDAFAAFARSVGPTVDWVFAIGAPIWQFIRRARSDRMLFDRVVELRRWSDQRIGELLSVRSDAAGLAPSFQELAAGGLPMRSVLPEDLERAERGFHRMIWDSADGNPAVALEIWRHSLTRYGGGQQVVVTPYREPPAADIERLPLSALFVLRAIVQLERAAADDIVECTRLSDAEVRECISFCLARGYAEPIADRIRISWLWYRTITRVLSRQHLLGQ